MAQEKPKEEPVVTVKPTEVQLIGAGVEQPEVPDFKPRDSKSGARPDGYLKSLT